MKRPQPKKHALCTGCFEIKPLLMPVAIIPGWPVVVWNLRCIDCRMKARYERAQNHPLWGSYAEAFKFSHSKSRRDAYDEWLQVNEPD